MTADDSSLVAEYFGYQSHWLVTRPGERIHYLDEGGPEGIPVLLLHGSAIGITAAANFYLTIPALVAAGHRVIAPDLYGYGFTEAPPGVVADRPHQVDLVLRLLDALNMPKVYVIGNSMGGMVLASFALDHAERVAGGVVVGTAGARWQAGSRFEPNQSSHKDMGEFSAELVRKSMEHLVHDRRQIPTELVEFRTRVAGRPGAYQQHLASTRLRELSKVHHPLDLERAGRCGVPMLFLFGREDRVNPPEDALAGAEAFANADLVVFGHCGHWTMVERAEEFNHLVLRFIAGWDRRIAAPPIQTGDLHGKQLVGSRSE
ncbi:alpha/beta fold hydrolase [Arthrobacter sp. Marseille-P9274]|uniref:alpha/beta fold hydrolase n=1 Tax=Arthrobacter sp. Marseille-P9274 TaxID=2866572 RepID=UPI0021C686CB|nr:alpha/beta hydrolase [Arthrobacter sp. Marseille-P9274]